MHIAGFRDDRLRVAASGHSGEQKGRRPSYLTVGLRGYRVSCHCFVLLLSFLVFPASSDGSQRKE